MAPLAILLYFRRRLLHKIGGYWVPTFYIRNSEYSQKEIINPICQNPHLPTRFYPHFVSKDVEKKWKRDRGKVERSIPNQKMFSPKKILVKKIRVTEQIECYK